MKKLIKKIVEFPISKQSITNFYYNYTNDEGEYLVNGTLSESEEKNSLFF